MAPKVANLYAGFSGTYGTDNNIQVAAGDLVVVSLHPCDSADTDFSAGKELDDDKMAVFNFQIEASDSYRICVCQKGVWTGSKCPSPKSAGSMTIQEDMTEVIFNEVRGTRLTIPQGWCEGGGAECGIPPMTAAYHLPGAGTVGFVSLVSVSRSCLSLAGNPSTGEGSASGWLPSDASRNIVGSLDHLIYMTTGWYKVCYKPDTSAIFNWQESGVVVSLQNEVTTLEINGLTAVSSVAPQVGCALACIRTTHAHIHRTHKS